jgi:hypothetical protein
MITYDRVLTYVEEQLKVELDASDPVEFTLADAGDGRGVYIASWRYEFPQPSEEELDAAVPAVAAREARVELNKRLREMCPRLPTFRGETLGVAKWLNRIPMYSMFVENGSERIMVKMPSGLVAVATTPVTM